MGRRIHWIKDHLNLISIALKNSFVDDEPTVQMRSARCLDVIANAINLHLLAQSNSREGNFDDQVKHCLQFWIEMIPSVVDELQRLDQSPVLKTTLCDVFSNIGVHVFERLEVNISNMDQMSHPKSIFVLCFAAWNTNPYYFNFEWTFG